jgi:HlyD family secretion protein
MCWRLISVVTSSGFSEVNSMRIVRIFLTVVVASAVTLGIVLFVQYRGTVSAAQQVPSSEVEESITVISDSLLVTVSGTGALAPNRQLNLSFEFSAPVREILVREGQVVKAGDVVTLAAQQASYDALIAPPRDVDIAAAEAALTVAQAQAGAASLGADATQVEIARLQAEIARNQLWQAQLQNGLVFAQAQQAADAAAARGIPVQPVGNAADNVTAQMNSAEFGVQIADTNIEAAQNRPADVAALASANAQIVAAQVQLDRLLNGPTEMQLRITETQLQIAQLAVDQAQAQLQRATLIAPFDGVVARNNLVIGELPPQGAAMQLIDTGNFFVDVAVDETDIVDMQVGQVVSLRFDAVPDADVTGVVSRVAVTPTRAGQLVTYTVRVAIDPTDAPIRIGMTATVSITVRELPNALVVPNRFIRIDRTTQQAFVSVQQDDGTITDVPVTLGVRNETETEIVSGLVEGQVVVLVPREAFNPIE